MTSALQASFPIYPRYYPRTITNLFQYNGTQNPVEVGPKTFNMTKGYTSVGVKDATTGYYFQFDVEGGNSADLSNPNSFLFIIQNSAVGCTVTFNTFTNSTNYTITTPSTDSGGRTYTFIFYNYPGILPTIQKATGTVLAGNLYVYSKDSVFSP
jgi:hypothetical protein